jgi:hypothetical protein
VLFPNVQRFRDLHGRVQKKLMRRTGNPRHRANRLYASDCSGSILHPGGGIADVLPLVSCFVGLPCRDYLRSRAYSNDSRLICQEQ